MAKTIYEMTAEELAQADLSTQEHIRLLCRLGFRRSEIARMLGVRYQQVFKATNPKYAPKRWQKILAARMETERSTRVVDIEEVPELA